MLNTHTHNTHTHNFIYLFKQVTQLYTQNENLTNQQYKRYLAHPAQRRHTIFSETENFNRNLDLLLLTETDGSGQLNISMQHTATYFDLVLKMFINSPTTI